MSTISDTTNTPTSFNGYDVEIFKGHWTKADCENNPNVIFVIGDNSTRMGRGGQAIIRGAENVMGIVTKRLPSRGYEAYYWEDDYEILCRLIDVDIVAIQQMVYSPFNDYNTVMLAEGGYGNGLAKLYETCPSGFEYLCKRLKEEFNFDNPNPLNK